MMKHYDALLMIVHTHSVAVSKVREQPGYLTVTRTTYYVLRSGRVPGVSRDSLLVHLDFMSR